VYVCVCVCVYARARVCACVQIKYKYTFIYFFTGQTYEVGNQEIVHLYDPPHLEKGTKQLA